MIFSAAFWIRASVAWMVFRFSQSDFFKSLTSLMESGILTCKPPMIFAPCFFKSLAAHPVASPLKRAMVAMQKTFFPCHIFGLRWIKSRTANGILEYCVGYASTINSCSQARLAAWALSIGMEMAAGSRVCKKSSMQCLVLPVPLKKR